MPGLRVTFVLPHHSSDPVGGYRVVYEYATALCRSGHSVGIVYLTDLTPDRNARFAYRYARNPLVARASGLAARWRSWYRFHRRTRLIFLRSEDVGLLPDADACIATFWTTAAKVAALPDAKGRKFYLIQHHETWGGPPREVDATWHLPLEKIVIARWLETLGARLGATRITHIPNGIDHSRFRIVAPPASRPMSILSLYHSLAFKGVADAVAVLARYHALYPQVRILMFGTPPRGPELPDWIAYVRSPSQDFLVRGLYNAHAVYLSASRSEGWGLPAAEAMACGCAFVGTEIGGFAEFAAHDRSALLSPVGDQDAMLANLVALTEDAALRSRIQATGTADIGAFTWERSGAMLEARLFSDVSPP